MKKGFAKFMSGLLSAAVAVNFAAPPLFVLASSDDTIASLSETLKTGLQNYETAIDISKFEMAPDQDNLSRLSEVLGYVRKMPEMFCIGFEDHISIQPVYAADGNLILGQVKFSYTNTREEAEALMTELNAKIDAVVSETVTPGMTELQKALNLHDYLVLNTVYDTEGTLPDRDGGSSAYDILICENGVCEGYAQAYNMLLDKVGISSIMVTSYDMNHAWNLVNIDNEWYHVDSTWDDPVPDAKGRVNHKYFMLSDDEIRKANPEAGRNYIHDKWDSKGIEATSKKYDHAFWQTVGTEIFTRGDQWYFVDNKGEYSRYTESTGEVDKFVSLGDERWYVWGQYSAYWEGKYVSLIISGDKVYYNSPTNIYKMNLDGSEKESQCYVNPYDTNGYVYGLKLDGNTVYAVIKQEPSDEGTLYEALDVRFEKKVSIIDTIVDSINKMEDGSSANFDFRDTESILPAAAIDAMRNRNIRISLDLGDYSWNIKGKDVTAEKANDLNLEIKKDQGTIPEEMLSSIADKRKSVIELDLQHEGDFGLKASINYALGAQYINNVAVLYSYDRLGSRMDKVNTSMVDSNGKLQMDLDQSASYALVLWDLQAPEDPIIQAPVKPPQEEVPAETTAEAPALTEAMTSEVTASPAETAVSKTAASETAVSETAVSETKASETTAEITSAVEVADPAETAAEVPAVTETTEITAASEPEEFNKTATGDLDGSGKVDLSDLTTLALYLLGEGSFSDVQLKIADVTGDGLVDLADLATMKQFLAHKIDRF
ncbi:transglutaminase domain-containing protein [Ruminococcus sp. HUN007]|uniref:transglutaminase domain-containing protein n=1 Tax=Ruminococcus sp. HUN007 TaxID=1514668 RepID=UPI000679B2A9|nr:transglutaminase domain-containing protein [Ruminococcus sp. HUN007]